MGWIIAFGIIWFVLRRRRRRMWGRWARMGPMYPGGPWLARGHAWGRGPGAWGPPMRLRGGEPLPLFDPGMRRPAPMAARESEFEALKPRYVAGELSDEQYEGALDVLFRTPEGRGQV
ncbi:MAG: hypothetical protein ACREKM_05100 [Longimicrobiales bacterium]